MPPLGMPCSDVRGCGLRARLLAGSGDNPPEDNTAWVEDPLRTHNHGHRYCLLSGCWEPGTAWEKNQSAKS